MGLINLSEQYNLVNLNIYICVVVEKPIHPHPDPPGQEPKPILEKILLQATIPESPTPNTEWKNLISNWTEKLATMSKILTWSHIL